MARRYRVIRPAPASIHSRYKTGQEQNMGHVSFQEKAESDAGPEIEPEIMPEGDEEPEAEIERNGISDTEDLMSMNDEQDNKRGYYPNNGIVIIAVIVVILLLFFDF